MRIGIDARGLATSEGAGIHRFAANIIRELGRIDQENDYYLYSKRGFVLPFDNARWRKRLLVRTRSRPATAWFMTGASSMILSDGLDVFWEPSHCFPLWLPSNVAKVLTVYDLVWRYYPGTMDYADYLFHRAFADRSVRMAEKIIAISDSTRRDLEAEMGVSGSKVSVAYPAPEAGYHPHERACAARHIREKYGVSEDYMCAVGTVEPRKNLVTLIEAVRILWQQKALHCQLLVVGAPGWKTSKIYASVKRCGLNEGQITFLGYMPEADLPLLYSGARLLAFPSLYEGFGIPLVEAMACGTPIVASNVSSIPEVVQDAALLVPPRDPRRLAEAIARLLDDPELASILIARGLRRARQFRWDGAAKVLLSVFEEIGSTARRDPYATLC